MKKIRATSMLYITPNDSHKSFYKKACVYTFEGGVILKSYETIVAACIDGHVYRTWDGYSATTQRHINAFLHLCGAPELGGKHNWEQVDMYPEYIYLDESGIV